MIGLRVALGFFLLVFMGSQAFCIDHPRDLVRAKGGKVRMPKQSSKLARVRLKVQVTDYERLLVRQSNGEMKHAFKPRKPFGHNLRARIEKVNHFYLGRWHIETQPLSWSKELNVLRMRLKFYKTYGSSQDVEERVGSVLVKGSLKGKDFLYSFTGSKNIQFKNKLGQPIADISVGPPKSAPGNYSRNLPPKNKAGKF